MNPASRNDEKMLMEAYDQISEGIFDRLAAQTSGAGQYVKNVGAALAGKTTSVSPAQAKMQSILQRSASDVLMNLYKMNLIPGAEKVATPEPQHVNMVIKAMQPVLSQLQVHYQAKAAADQAKALEAKAKTAQTAATAATTPTTPSTPPPLPSA